MAEFVRLLLTSILDNNEPLVPLTVIAREVGKHPTTAGRWATKGVRLADGTRVRLEVVKVGRELMTSRAAWQRFLAATSAPMSAGRIPTAPTAGERRKSAEAAVRGLQKLGA